MSSAAVLQNSLTRHIEREEERQRPLDFRLIGRLYECTAAYGAKRIWLLLLVVIRAIQLPALTWCLAAVIRGPIASRDPAGVLQGAFAFALLAVSTQIVLHFRQRLALELGEAVVCDLRSKLFRHIQRMPLRWFQTARTGRIISRMTSDMEDIRAGVQDVFYVSLVQLIQMLIAAAAMIWFDRLLFLILIVLVPVIRWINQCFHQRLSAALRNMRESYSRVTATLVESVVGIRVSQAFCRETLNIEAFGALTADHSAWNTGVLRTQGIFQPLLELNSQVVIALLLLAGGWRVLTPGSEAHVGDVVGFLFMSGLFFAPIAILGTQYHQALTAMAGAERLFRLLDTEPDWVVPPDAVSLSTVRGQVEFRDVSFSWDGIRTVLHNISFTAAPGAMFAFVGTTGSGKSSLINLVAKFCLPTSGAVLIDGYDTRLLDDQYLHRSMGIVPQQNFLFGGTVADNIRFGRPTATDAEIQRVLSELGCADLLDALPQGISTPVGESGCSLSSGQRQLICFARALLADPAILILDEATSSMDSQTEDRLQGALERLLKGRTAFVVAHRLSTIRRADVVMVLHEGRIVERGTHDVLLERNGVYAALHRRFTAE
jgi:ATP-binding cassette subfamily B protein